MGKRGAGSTGGGAPARRMGRPSLADRDTIIGAALHIGFAQLTMPAVAEHLGLSHSTLYRYFPSRDALAAAAADRAVNEIEWPRAEADWRSFLTATAFAHWRLYSAHPGLAQEITALRLTGPALVERDNRTGAALLGFGFPPADATLVMDMLAELVTQAFLAVPPRQAADPVRSGAAENGPVDGPVDATQQRRRELIEPWLGSYHPQLREVLVEAVSGPPVAWFERKLALFLDGVATRVAPPGCTA